MIERWLRSTAILIVCFISAVLVLLFSWLPRGGIYPFISQRFWGPSVLYLAGVKLTVRGLDKLDGVEHALFFSNHQSYFDIPALTSAIPIPLYFIAKKEILYLPVFGWGMYAIGMVFVDRKNRARAKESMLRAARTVAKGKSILSFPEGTRSPDGTLQKFKKGIFNLAKTGNFTLIPVAVKGTHKVHAPGGKLHWGVEVQVEVGQPISSEEVKIMDLPTLTQTAQSRLRSLLN